MNYKTDAFVLWLFQQSAVTNALTELKSGNATLLVSPTGSGKTVMASEIAKHFRRVLFIAHRQEIIDQAGRSMGPNVTAMGIGSVLRHGPNDTDLLIIDEAHRSVAKTYREIIERYPNAARLGLTATPLRTDGKGLRDAFSVLIEASTTAELISLGRLVRYRALEAPDEALRQLAALRRQGGDYHQSELSALMNQPRLVGDVVKEYQRHGIGRKTIAFAVSVTHSQAIVSAMNAAGIRAAHLDGKASTEVRRATLDALRSGEIDVLSNVNLFTEGWDCPEVSCVIVARPTMSLTLHLQSIGRGMRTANGKADLIILDHAGNIERHGLPDRVRDWSLESDREKASRETEIAELERLSALGFDSIEAELEEKRRINEATYSAETVALIIRQASGLAPLRNTRTKKGISNKCPQLLRLFDIRPIGKHKGRFARYGKQRVDECVNLFNATITLYEVAAALRRPYKGIVPFLESCGATPVKEFIKAGNSQGRQRYLKSDIARIIDTSNSAITSQEAARRLGLSISGFRKFIARNKLRYIRGRRGNARLWNKAEIESFTSKRFDHSPDWRD